MSKLNPTGWPWSGCWLIRLVIAASVLLPAGNRASATEPVGTIEAELAAAGNATDDEERYRLLVALAQRDDWPDTWREELEQLLPVARAYAGVDRAPSQPTDHGTTSEAGYLGFFYWSIRATKDTPAPDYPPAPSPGSPLHPLHALYRGRMLVWYPIQRGVVAADPALRDIWYGEARRLLTVAREAYPENNVIGMYLGQPIAWPSVTPDPRAPEWANLQRTALEKWTDVVEWWIDHRQLSNGEFGGGWGDDVEMWRTWPAVLLAFRNEKIQAAQERLSEGVYGLPHMRAGFTEAPRDAEHAAEDSSDALMPMLQLKPSDSCWMHRADRIGELMAKRWLGTNDEGALQFRSAYIGAAGVDPDPVRAADTNYHFRTVQPLLLRWQSEPDYAHGPLLAQWIDTWVNATMTAVNGKPAGIPPATLRWPMGEPGLPGQWWRAGFYGTGLYDYPAALDEMLPALLVAYRQTGEERYLEPIRALLEACETPLPSTGERAATGSAPWALERARPAVLAVLPRYRAVSGDGRFDDLLRREGNAWARFAIDGDLAQLLPGLRQLDRALAVNFPAYTQEVRWTDRLMGFAGKYLRHYHPDAPRSPDVNLLYMMATGDAGHPSYLPQPQVYWQTSSRDLAVLVRPPSGVSFEAELFHFGEQRRPVGAVFPLLRDGTYRVLQAEWNEAAGRYGPEQTRTWHRRAGAEGVLQLELPAGRLVRVRLEVLSHD